MICREVFVGSKKGLHLRKAREIALFCRDFGGAVTLENGAGRADGRSVMEMLMLAAGEGSPLTIRVDGDGEEEAADALADLFDETSAVGIGARQGDVTGGTTQVRPFRDGPVRAG